ncbi:MAG: 3-phosphoshikimate 1-carboxyvinyltransferase [Gemmatimonadaceae bacterium]|nr:3-phosphoshikimate 1-carboxyvinyltransferase [Gemmatimonadaceae bacterium]
MASVTAVAQVTVPGDKSLSHRALMFAALGSGVSVLRGVLPSADVRSTAVVLRALGVDLPVQWAQTDELRIIGMGRRGLRQPVVDLDCGNSGTTTRLVAGVVAGHHMRGTFVGDASLSRRPMRRIARPLTQMGAAFSFAADDGLPMTVQGGELRDIAWVSPTASAQVKSAILLAALVAGVSARVQEPTRSRDHTERMLAALGAPITVTDDAVLLDPVGQLAPLMFEVPGDPSSALFLIASAVLRGQPIEVRNVGVNDTRSGALAVLMRMGVALTLVNARDVGGEPVADIHVAPCAGLRGVTIGGDEIPALIDEIPMLACLAACAVGETRITDAAELRVKESDRITAVVSNLRAIGAVADELPDGLVIDGRESTLKGSVLTHADHRIAMAFGVLGAMRGNEVTLDDPQCVDVSFPGFWQALTELEQAR